MMEQTNRKPYLKMTFEDLEMAEEFFENDKHLAEFLLAVSCYYRGKNFKIKTKIVQKFFNSYKKTMDFIIKSKQNGLKGRLQRIENESVKNSTLEGVAKPLPETVAQSITTKTINSNNKREKENNNYYYTQNNIPTEVEVVAFFSDNNFCTSQARKFYKKLSASKFTDKTGQPIENWKAYALSLPEKELTGGKTAEKLRLDELRRLSKIPLEERLQN